MSVESYRIRNSDKQDFDPERTSMFDPERFGEDDYKKELDLHEIKIPKRSTAKRTYTLLSHDLLKEPKSGVFRDFVEYGVYPVRVSVNRLPVDIPLLVKFFDESQLEVEIVNQSKQNERQKIQQLLKEKNHSFVENCYTLIRELEDRKYGPYRRYGPILHKIMVTVNILTYFSVPFMRKITKVREQNISYLFNSLPPKIIHDEIQERRRIDPGYTEFGRQISIPEMIMDLTLRKPYTPMMREIIRNAKKISYRHELHLLLARVGMWSKHIVPLVVVKLRPGQWREE